MADYLTFEFNMISHGRGYLIEEDILSNESDNLVFFAIDVLFKEEMNDSPFDKLTDIL